MVYDSLYDGPPPSLRHCWIIPPSLAPSDNDFFFNIFIRRRRIIGPSFFSTLPEVPVLISLSPSPEFSGFSPFKIFIPYPFSLSLLKPLSSRSAGTGRFSYICLILSPFLWTLDLLFRTLWRTKGTCQTLSPLRIFLRFRWEVLFGITSMFLSLVVFDPSLSLGPWKSVSGFSQPIIFAVFICQHTSNIRGDSFSHSPVFSFPSLASFPSSPSIDFGFLRCNMRSFTIYHQNLPRPGPGLVPTIVPLLDSSPFHHVLRAIFPHGVQHLFVDQFSMSAFLGGPPLSFWPLPLFSNQLFFFWNFSPLTPMSVYFLSQFTSTGAFPSVYVQIPRERLFFFPLTDSRSTFYWKQTAERTLRVTPWNLFRRPPLLFSDSTSSFPPCFL